MDLHIYRNSEDRNRDLRDAANRQGAVLGWNALTLAEVAGRVCPHLRVASAGESVAAFRRAVRQAEQARPVSLSYLADAVADIKRGGVTVSDLRRAGADDLARIIQEYDAILDDLGVVDPADLPARASAALPETSWLERFDSAVLHSTYDLSTTEFELVREIIQRLPSGATIQLFNTTTNVRATRFAEWTWQKFVTSEELADRTFPEFCQSASPNAALLERLFDKEPGPALENGRALSVLEAPSRYREVEAIGHRIIEQFSRGVPPDEIAIVVRNMDLYGEMIADVLARYGIPVRFATGLPLPRVPLIKYWFAALDLVSGDRNAAHLSRVMSSAYFVPRLTPASDVSGTLSRIGYIDRHHLPASHLARRKSADLLPQLVEIEDRLDAAQTAVATVDAFLDRFSPQTFLTGQDVEAWETLAPELRAAGKILGAISFAEFCETATDIAARQTVSRGRSRSSAVWVTTPFGLGHARFRQVMALGFSDGEFPSREHPNPALSDATIERIHSIVGERRLMDSVSRNRREPLYLFSIIDAATEHATLSYPTMTVEGQAVAPSVYIHEVCRHFAEPPVTRVPATGFLHEAGEWSREVARRYREGVLPEAAAERLLGQDLMTRLRSMRTVLPGDVPPGSFLPEVWTPRDLETLNSCPFQFLGRSLRLNIVRAAPFDVSNLELGFLVHEILREFHRKPVPPLQETAEREIEEILTRKLSSLDVSGEGVSGVYAPEVWKIRRAQLVQAVRQYVHFVLKEAWHGFETATEWIGQALPVVELGGVRMTATADRIGVRRNGDEIDAIRVEDFKFSVGGSNDRRGTGFDLPVWGELARQALGAGADVQLQGRRIYLRSPHDPVEVVNLDGGTLAETTERIRQLSGLAAVGQLRPDPDNTQICERCAFRRLCRYHAG